MKKLWIAASMLFLSCSSCTHLPSEPAGSTTIVGTWVLEKYEDNATLMRRSQDLDPTNYGFVIAADGKFVERKNAGWCGTPPISYTNFNGTWEAQKDTVLSIEVGFWGGRTTYEMDILSVDDTALRFVTRY